MDRLYGGKWRTLQCGQAGEVGIKQPPPPVPFPIQPGNRFPVASWGSSFLLPTHPPSPRLPGLTGAGQVAGAAVGGDVVQPVVPVDGEGICQAQHLLQGVIDEYQADEGAEAFLGEAGEVPHQVTGLGGHQHHSKKGHPEPNPEAELQVVQAVIPGGKGGSEPCQ